MSPKQSARSLIRILISVFLEDIVKGWFVDWMGQQQQTAQVEEGGVRRTRWLGTANLGRAHSDPDKGGCLLVARAGLSSYLYRLHTKCVHLHARGGDL